MKTIRRSNGILIRDFPSFKQMERDEHEALSAALGQLRELRENVSVAVWRWTDKVYVLNRPDPEIVADTPQLLRVVAGAGTIVSDELSDLLDYGYWIYVPEGVRYTLLGRVISGQNFRVITLPLK
jgi:mannose-6-phosphate isomerase-like protein (cupin superfamily)